VTQTLARPNRYPAACIRCNGRVEAGAGLLARTDDGKWAADHPADCPPKPMAVAQPVARVQHDGIYQTADGTIYKVQIAKQGSGNLYAKRLVITPNACGGCERCDGEGTCAKGTFQYAAGAIHTLRADERMSEADARAFGALYGICCACGADLTDERSIAAGIGPICGAKYF
jgi:hypothetical protein